MAIQNPFDSNAKPKAAGPTKMNVSSEATTAGQLNSLLASNSPYLSQARARSAQQSNARGLINSTMGVQAGEAAAIDAALPIAQSDANAFFTADQFNATNENQFTRDENMFNRDDYLQNQQRDFTAEQSGLDRAQQTALQNSQQQFQGTQADLDRTQQTALQKSQQQFQGTQADLDRLQQTALQNNQQKFQTSQAALDRAQQSTLLSRELSSVEARQTQQLKAQADLAKIDADLRANLLERQISSEKDLTEMRAQLQQTQSALDAKLRDEAALLEVTRGRNANIDQSMVQMGQNYLSSVERIMSSNIPPEAQPALINELKAQYQDQLNFASSLKNTTVLASGQAGV